MPQFPQEGWDVPADGKNAVAMATGWNLPDFQGYQSVRVGPYRGHFGQQENFQDVDSKWLAEKMLPDPETVVGENFQPLYQYDVQAIFELAKG